MGTLTRLDVTSIRTLLVLLNASALNARLSPICHLLALLGVHHIFHVSGSRVKLDGTQSNCLALKGLKFKTCKTVTSEAESRRIYLKPFKCPH
jgi:hypothetical protein